MDNRDMEALNGIMGGRGRTHIWGMPPVFWDRDGVLCSIAGGKDIAGECLGCDEATGTFRVSVYLEADGHGSGPMPYSRELCLGRDGLERICCAGGSRDGYAVLHLYRDSRTGDFYCRDLVGVARQAALRAQGTGCWEVAGCTAEILEDRAEVEITCTGQGRHAMRVSLARDGGAYSFSLKAGWAPDAEACSASVSHIAGQDLEEALARAMGQAFAISPQED